MIEIEQNNLEKEIDELQVELKKFEEKYGQSSDDAYTKFNNGKLGDDLDFFEWHALYEIYLKDKRKLDIITGA